MFDETDQLSVNTLRMLSVDEVQAANSGHPGLPLDAAPMAYVLWQKFMNTNPKDSKWFNRDRFVLSAGHGSALLYSLLHLSGYDLSLNDLKGFRQVDSKTPGHPEYGHTDGVEATTGPLGQGIGMAVGMAMAELHLGATYNRDDFKVVDHYTYALCGDGDLMEGVSHEAASLAGHYGLDKLVMLYDSNDISLDGPLSNSFNENVKQRFEAYHWNYLRVEDGNNLDEIEKAIAEAKSQHDKPTIIEVKTQIGYGSPDAGTNKVHGAPFKEDALKKLHEFYNWDKPAFTVPDGVYTQFENQLQARGANAQTEWKKMLADYSESYPELAQKFNDAVVGKITTDFSFLPQFEDGDSKATRATGSEILQSMADNIPTIWGGSADLFSSNKTQINDSDRFSKDNPTGRNLWFGVREFGEATAVNGIALHGGTRVYGSTFMAFSDYMRGALRLAAIQHLPVTYVFTHDSIAVGEDGPTHEPVEQLVSLQAIPDLQVIRPADANEVVEAWKVALSATDHPTVIILTRQGVPALSGARTNPDGLKHGGYVISPQQGEKPEAIIMASGSEVSLAIESQHRLFEKGKDVSVVSMPSIKTFNGQSKEYQEKVLPSDVRKRVSVEMGSCQAWGKFVGLDGKSLGIDEFGLSGNGPTIVKKFGFTPENVVKTVESLY
ncbi:transketolase [Paucilactobacillus hokkaidonensis JCM 18461]|uniref:Transketolase n=2 Tax=Paucilactobacillus hokkaidonensis TaxID=1193095 RepID=A0A0A1GXW5_9LACO|nr:transketolase [Paucilactobacillus hokkaidonensis]KRO09284.1 transketolase [Paucilactobacillus hokkaidonensis]BAP85306.1 transketolase [Paucilactobacillus hokkaidonensis JCM 18461]